MTEQAGVQPTTNPPSSQAPDASDDGNPRAPLWATLIATFFGIGRLKPGPGTWASVATVLLWAAASTFLPPASRTWVAVLATIAVTLIGIPAATCLARATGIDDPQFVVIDEVAGQLLALIAVPLSWKTFLAGLILFRVFDILKPFPIRRLEQLPEGTGIMMDDLGAGLLAFAIVHLLLYFRLLIA